MFWMMVYRSDAVTDLITTGGGARGASSVVVSGSSQAGGGGGGGGVTGGGMTIAFAPAPAAVVCEGMSQALCAGLVRSAEKAAAKAAAGQSGQEGE